MGTSLWTTSVTCTVGACGDAVVATFLQAEMNRIEQKTAAGTRAFMFPTTPMERGLEDLTRWTGWCFALSLFASKHVTRPLLMNVRCRHRSPSGLVWTKRSDQRDRASPPSEGEQL